MSITSSTWSLWPAPAKLNLFLRILGRREDGFHELQTVFQLLDWGDTVFLRPRSDLRLVLERGAPGVPPELDLGLRAARLLQREAGAGGADIRIEKQIPFGAGLGGGSSDAASVLVGLNALWNLGLDQDRLAGLGLQLGADVPVFVRGLSAWAEGLGEILTPLTLPERWYLLLFPPVQIATAELFRSPELTRNGERATITGFVSQELMDNAFTPLVRAMAPSVDAALTLLERFGAARMSGTGSTCFLAFDSEADARAVARECAGRFPVQVVRGVDRSGLSEALAHFAAGSRVVEPPK